MKYISPHDFYLETNGRIIDVDGMYGGQCWDLFAYYTKITCNKTFPCIQTGYVIDLWNTFDQIGLNEYFERVVGNYQDGDWLVWKAPANITTKSHIAMFRLDNGDGTNVILTQNPSGNPNYTYQMIADYYGVVGALRPKIYIPTILSPKPVLEDKTKEQIYIEIDNIVKCYTELKETDEVLTSDKFLSSGYYDVLEKIEIDGKVWYKIGENYYILNSSDIRYIPIEEKEEVESDEEIKEDNTVKEKIINKIFKWIKNLVIRVLDILFNKFNM